MKHWIILISMVALFGCAVNEEVRPSFSDMMADATLIDLTHAFDSSTVYWPTAEGFILHTESYGFTDAGFFYAANSFSSAEHGGTHLDAPIHFAEGQWTTDEIPLRSLVGPAAVINVSDQCARNPDYLVTTDDIGAWEAGNGTLPDGSIVLIHTGFSNRWPDRASYMGTDERGAEAVAKLHFPGLAPEAAEWLVAERNLAAIGIDTPSIDFGQSSDYRTHQMLFAANIPAFENIAHPDRLPATGAWVFALPMKIRGGSGGPLRMIAVVPPGN